jgi:hypothetical protein
MDNNESQSIMVHSWEDLRQLGINMLTGESCGYSLRLLCDVSEEGKALLADYFGMPGIQLAANWNSRVGEQPAVGSIMLSRKLLMPLAEFALLRKGALAVVESDSMIMGVFDQTLLDRYGENTNLAIRRNFATDSRVTHAMTGRTV